MRYAALLLLLCACTSLSTEQRDQLAFCQRNAKYYFEGGRYDQAMTQIEKGLELDPDDYQLQSMRGSVLLKQSGSALGQDHRRLDEATDYLTKVYEMRGANRHEPYLLLNYALALQKQGRRFLGEAMNQQAQATRAVDKDKQALQAKADEVQQQSTEKLQTAREVLGVLVERGELVRISHYHLLLIAQDLRDNQAFENEAKLYLEQLAKDQATTTRNLERTTIVGYEQEQIKTLRDLKQEEIEVRGLLAEHYFTRKNYEAAKAMIDRVLEIDPARSADYYNRGRLLVEMKRPTDAKADFRKFLAMSDLPANHEKKVRAFEALNQ